MRLKNANLSIPGGFIFWSPELRFKAAKGASIQQIARALVAARLGNPKLTAAKHWATDLPTVMAEVEEVNANWAAQNGWNDYVLHEGAATAARSRPAAQPRPFVNASGQPQPRVVSASPFARGVRNVVAGSLTLADMFGGPPVDSAKANARASVCAGCELNDKEGKLLDYFTVPAAAFVNKMLGMVKDLDLKTEKDSELGVCRACDCPLRTKVHSQLAHILAHIPADSKAALAPQCWITAEEKAK